MVPVLGLHSYWQWDCSSPSCIWIPLSRRRRRPAGEPGSSPPSQWRSGHSRCNVQVGASTAGTLGSLAMYPQKSTIWPVPRFPETEHKNQIALAMYPFLGYIANVPGPHRRQLCRMMTRTRTGGLGVKLPVEMSCQWLLRTVTVTLHIQAPGCIWNGEVHYMNRVFILARTDYSLVQKMYNNSPVHTSTYWVCTKTNHVCWTPIGALIQYWSTTAYMSRTHSIVSHTHTTLNSTVHTSMYHLRTLGK